MTTQKHFWDKFCFIWVFPAISFAPLFSCIVCIWITQQHKHPSPDFKLVPCILNIHMTIGCAEYYLLSCKYTKKHPW